MRGLTSSSATRSPLTDTSTCSLMPIVSIVVRPKMPPSGSLCIDILMT